MSQTPGVWAQPSFAGLIGVARRDITPPPGIYARNWGAASHDIAIGVHRPLTGTVLTIRASVSSPLLVLAAIDAGWFRGPDGADMILEHVRRELGLAPGAFMLALSHTHAGPSISPAERHKPGGELIEPYVLHIARSIVDAAREAQRSEWPAVAVFAQGRCDLAAQRDLYLRNERRYVCGFNPGADADDTCLVARITRVRDGAVIATLVNYACHPTTLGWANRLISPDYVGAMRETVEAATGGAPCLFLQGASGDLAPRRQYGDDPATADAGGRQLGHAVLSAMESMLPPGRSLALAGVVESGAPLAIWSTAALQPDPTVAFAERRVPIPLRPTLRSIAVIAADLASCSDPATRERLHREALVVKTVGPGFTTRRDACLWRLGDALLVGHPDEAYSCLQTAIRKEFSGRPVFVLNVVNGWGGYLCPRDHYDRNVYQVNQSPYAAGCLEILTRACIDGLAALAMRDQANRCSSAPANRGAGGSECGTLPTESHA